MLCADNTVRKVGSAGEIDTPAKLNLCLEVQGPRADGFHDLETLMVPVRVYDRIRWSECDNLELQVNQLLTRGCTLAPPLLSCEDNLVLRAARLLAAEAGIQPKGRFDLIKRIPAQAGMGGGSSDAAAALVLANHVWGIGYTLQQLQPLAAQLGSDVPFFLHQGAAVCRGRGELVERVVGLPRLHFVVVKPDAGLSTAKVFRQLAAERSRSNEPWQRLPSHLTDLVARLQVGDIAAAGQFMTNRLEAVASGLEPWLVALRATLERVGCLVNFMTGSGSAHVGIVRSASQARCVAQRLKGMNLGTVFATATC